MQRILAFDIGIKNLAFCILENGQNVIALENCNILAPVEQVPCFMCKVKASYKAGDHFFCKRHIPGTHELVPELEKGIPQVATLKELVKKYNCEDLGKTKEKLLESLRKRLAIPYKQEKQQNASKISLEEIHDALRKFVREKWSLFSDCTYILLENQPAFKNPHMKSVQVLLFATLREQFIQHNKSPSYHLVHAKKKTGDAKKGDDGYKERKQKSEDRVQELFDSEKIKNTEFYTFWKNSKKKSDMADAICMCVDFKS
jgi:hypothetical protein